MLGDFNSNSIWDSEYPRTLNHSALVSRLDALGMVSAYHAYHDEEHGAETRPTFFLYRHENRPYHIDFAFLPKTWRDHIRNVDLGTFSDWSGHSDHVPLTVDLEHSEI